MDLSIIIPTQNRLPQLTATVEALARQEMDGIEAELVVVDNGSEDGTQEWARERGPDFPYPFRLLEEPSEGVSAARNRAVTEAEGRMILSINDDTAPSSSKLVRGHLRAHVGESPDTAVLGRITYPVAAMEADPFLAWLNDDAQFAFGRLERGESPLPNHFYTAHLSFLRERFLAVGGMDRRLKFGFEDAEFGARMQAAGVRLVYKSDLVLDHDHPVTPSDWRMRAERMGAAGALVNRLHHLTPPLAQPALSPYWRALELADWLLARLPTDWRWLPPVLRQAVYQIINQGSYTRGYRRAW